MELTPGWWCGRKLSIEKPWKSPLGPKSLHIIAEEVQPVMASPRKDSACTFHLGSSRFWHTLMVCHMHVHAHVGQPLIGPLDKRRGGSTV